MDTAILVEELDKRAIELVKTLNEKRFPFTVAALMKNQDAEDWYIVLGIPELRTKGARDSLATIYDIIRDANIKDSNFNLTLNDIKLLDDRDVTLLLLKRRFKASPDVSRIVFTGNYIDGIRFPDSIIYQIK